MDDEEPITRSATRRDFLRTVGGAMAAGAAVPMLTGGHAATPESLAPRIALCDRAIGLRQGLGVFEIARDAGCDGAEVDLGRLGPRGDMINRLAEPAGRRLFTAAAAAAGVAISSVAATCFATQSVLKHRMADDILNDWLTALVRTGTRTGVLTFGVACDLSDVDVRRQVIERLKPLADRASADSLVIALDTPLPADALATLLDAVDSPAVQACIRIDEHVGRAVGLLGADRVAQLRYRDDDRPAAASLPLTLWPCWPGWVVIERVQQTGEAVVDCAAAAQRVRVLIGRTRF